MDPERYEKVENRAKKVEIFEDIAIIFLMGVGVPFFLPRT